MNESVSENFVSRQGVNLDTALGEKTSSTMQTKRLFPTSAAERYDRALRKSQAMNPLPDGVRQPKVTAEWPPENVVLLERYRDWLVGIGSAESVINQHRIPMAGHLLGLSLKPFEKIHWATDREETLMYVRAKGKGETWERNCAHSLTWFGRFLREARGEIIIDKPTFGETGHYLKGLPEWLIAALTKLLHIRQAGWRPSRMAQSTYHFWYKSTQIWRWLFEHTDIQQPIDVTRDHLFRYIDEQLAAGYKVASINHDLHTFQGTLRFLQQQGMGIPHPLLTLRGLKKPASLPRFLTESQIVTLRNHFNERTKSAKTAVGQRNARLDQAAFYLLWQTGMRVSELEDLRLDDIDFEAGNAIIREAKGLKDRAVYLTERVMVVLRAYLEMRGPALTDHLFIYRHKQISKDLIRSRMKTASKRLGFKATPHMLRHTFATQLVNAGAKITTIQSLLGHQRLNTTMTYARVHDKTIIDDYFKAMEQIEGAQQAVLSQQSASDKVNALLEKMVEGGLSDKQQQVLDELRRCLSPNLESS